MIKKGLIALIIAIVTFSSYITPSFASNEGFPYLVEPVFPENQDKDIDHYISFTPDSNSLKQELGFLVTNKTNKKQTINIKLFNAYTSANGGIQYTLDGTEDNSIIDKNYEIKQYIQAPDEVELDGGESKLVRLKLNITGIDGTVLGAVAFQGDGDNAQTDSEGISFEIKNEINTIYGIAVNFPTDHDYQLQFGEPFVDPMASYYAIRLPITLNKPLLLKDVDVKYEVYFKGEKLFYSKDKIDFAPMTKTNFSIPWEYDKIKGDGIYTLKGCLSYKNKKDEQEEVCFEEEFKYEDIKQSNTGISKILNGPEVEGFSNLWFLLVLLLLPVWWIYQKRNERYVLFSDSPIEPEIIREDEELYNKVQPKKDSNPKAAKYEHIYIRAKDKDKRFVYKKIKTVVLNID